MKILQKIYITSDFLMTKEIEQYSNRRWLKDLLERPIHASTGKFIESFFSSLNQANCFSRKTFFELSQVNLDIDSTQFYFDDADIQDASLEYLQSFIADCLIIGYELSEQTKKILDRLGLIYIDIWLHPIRYLDDILFAFQSNNIEVQKKLFEFNINSYIYGLYADRLKIQGYKGWNRNEIKLPSNSALFVGQMLNDKSVNKHGKFLSILDFKQEFESLVSQHGHVYYSRHPYLKSGDEEILNYLKSFKNVSITTLPTYQLLGAQQLKTVMSISSSVLEEAKYFRKNTVLLYQPVIELSDSFSVNRFASIYQKFVNPKFWEEILSPIMFVHSCPNISYLNEKDKLRDMLGFYWSYKTIDKLEELRSNHNFPKKKTVNPISKVSKKKTTSYEAVLSNSDFKDLKKMINDSSVISFDIFDTLLERQVYKPDTVFHLMDSHIYNGPHKIDNFLQTRRNSRNISKHLSTGEEISLRDRYIAMSKELNISEDTALNFMKMELDIEKNISIAKAFGKKAYEYAKRKNKRIILISDTFYTDDFIMQLLLQAGYTEWDALYTSSKYNLLKDTGNLYQVVLDKEKLSAEHILHIGDNKHADIKQANAKGFKTFYAPATREIFCQRYPLIDQIDSIRNTAYRELSYSLFFEKTLPYICTNNLSYCNGKIENFGYLILGNLFLGFSKWILDSSLRDGIEDIYFLSRDGDIVKKCYDLLVENIPSAPKSHYIYASRRAIRVAALKTKKDIVSVLETNFTPMALSDLLLYRFGIDAEELHVGIFAKYNFEKNTIANWKTNKEQLLAFFLSEEVSTAVLLNAEKERTTLHDYYSDEGLIDTHKSFAFVDIGHSGTLQAGIIDLMGLKHTCGYYFATFNNILSNVLPPHQTFGYMANQIDPKLSNGYMENILMYELCFLNDQDSFIAMGKHDGSFIPQFLITQKDDRARKKFAKEVHKGIENFVKDILRCYTYYQLDFSKITLSAKEATTLYECFLVDARVEDVKLFQGLAFENSYSGRHVQWIIPPSKAVTNKVVWNKGYNILYSQENGLVGHRAFLHRSIGFIGRFGKARLYKKYLEKPQQYYYDSNKRLIRWLGQYIYKNDGE